MSTLDNLRKTAKRWLKALRANDAEARARLARANPKAPADVTLRDVQHALAREQGHESWVALTHAATAKTATAGGSPVDDADVLQATGGRTHAERVATFLHFACWDHHVHGKGNHRMHDRAAGRLLAQHPEIARDSLYTAVVAGDIDEVRRILAERPEAAREAGGSRGWTPILYLCYARFTHQPTIDHAIAIARELLDRGASPNDFYMAGDSHYTALVGAAGEGEQDSPRQPYAEELFQLLLDRGADPFDMQVLYNTHFSGEILWWLERVYAHSMKTGREAAWANPDWRMLDMGGYGTGAFFLLSVAITKNNVALAEWVLSHGANANLPEDAARHRKFTPPTTLYQDAVLRGAHEIAALLLRHGAEKREPTLSDEEQYLAACLRLDRPAVISFLERHPEYLGSPHALFAAARADRADVVAMLLDLGVPIEIEDRSGQRALHEAAGHNALSVARLLVDRGAEIDPRERHYHATPIGFAAYGDRRQTMDFLSGVTKNVWTLVFRGYVDRLRVVLAAEPDLAKVTTNNGSTPLWWLPDDEDTALAIVELLLTCGVDPSARNTAGETAADWAMKRGMRDVARRLGVETISPPTAPAAPVTERGSRNLEMYSALAQDLVFAFESGQPAAMERIHQRFGRAITWEELRAGVRRRLDEVPSDQRPDGYFALPHARILIARDAGFATWADLVASLDSPLVTIPPAQTAAPSPTGDIVPVEMGMTLPMELIGGVYSTTTEVWATFTAARAGDLERVKAMVTTCPELIRADYNYMPLLHLAVREGHEPLVRYLLDHGGAAPEYVTYPYKDTLSIVARDRGYEAIAQMIEAPVDEARQLVPKGASVHGEGHIDYGTDEQRLRFQKSVHSGAIDIVEATLRERPELATDPTISWSEGVLMMPANRRNRKMIELLIRHGARVPDVTKWGRAYYFKHDDIAAFLMANGMSPHHMNCHRTTLLHDMAQEGNIRKATLLLDRGADIDAVDDEFRSTPLGLAARWGHGAMVTFLLARGADPSKSGAEWASPLAWAQKKGHSRVEAELRRVGAR